MIIHLHWVPTFKKISSDLAGWWIFWTIFHEDFKNVNFINIGHTPSTLNFCPRSPRTGSASGYVGRSLASTGFVWSKNHEGTFVRIEKLSFWESPVKIRDVAGTPNLLQKNRKQYQAPQKEW